MTTQTLIETSNAGYRGFQVDDPLRWEGLRKNFGKQAYEASLDSQPLTVWLSGYFTGEDLLDPEGESSEEVTSLPEGDQNLGKELYLDCQRRAGLRDTDHPDHGVWKGVWFADAVDYDAKKPANRTVPKGFRYAVYIRGVEGWEQTKGGVYIPQGGTRIPVEMPISEGAFAVPKGIHIYDQLTGVPKMVEPDRNKALRTYMDIGLTKEQSERRLSKVWAMRNSGIAVVGSDASPGDGPLDLYFSSDPGSWSDVVGSVAASRLASGASPDSENVIPRSEYSAKVKSKREAIQRADVAERKLSELRAVLERK